MTKEKLLELFEMQKGEYLSGEAIAKELGLTRVAIWKQINLLKEEGYDIESVKKRGYRLNVNSDILSLTRLKQFLNPQIPIENITFHKTVSSTNEEAFIRSIEAQKAFMAVASEKQEKGEARKKGDFYSPEGKGVYLSVVIQSEAELKEMSEMIRLNGKAIKQAILRVTDIKCEVTEENNMLWKGQKLGGIMTQMIVEGESQIIKKMIIGVGIYVHEAEQGKVAMTDITGKYCNRSELIAAILNELYEVYIQRQKS